MDKNTFHRKLSELYACYNEIIKPLIADIESKYQEFPDSIFNEIRAFNDHVARCYIKGVSDDRIIKEIERAESHIVRITLDCYKYLAVWLYDYFENFKADFDISLIDNGEFAPHFYDIQAKGMRTIRNAKENESYNKEVAYNKYQEAYNIYSGLYVKIEEYFPKIKWAKKVEVTKRKRDLNTNIWFLIASLVISAIISANIPWGKFFNWLLSLFS